MKSLDRRTVLRGAGGVAIALPFLEAMLPRRAAAATPPRRFVFFFHSNGVNADSWFPKTAPGPLTLTPPLEPLRPVQDRVVALQGVNMETARANPGNGHNVGMTNLLTARKFLLEKQTQFGAIGWGAGTTIDQEIAAKLGQTTKFASLQFGVQTFKSYGANAYSYISYAGPQKPIPSEDDPRKMFARVFSDVGSTAGDAQARLDRRKSVLDFVADDFRQLGPRLAGGDRAKLDSHFTAIREIESRLTVRGQPSAGCSRPAAPTITDYNNNDRLPEIGKLQMDLLAMALACDLTRVATLQWSSGQSGTTHKWVGTTGSHHGISHQTDATAVATLLKIQTWYVTQLAYLAQAMARLTEGTGSVLDSSIIVSGSEVAVGQSHTFKDIPFLLVGGAGGAIKGGRFLRYTAAAHNDLYVSVMNALGIAATRFGDPNYSKGPLAGLVA